MSVQLRRGPGITAREDEEFYDLQPDVGAGRTERGARLKAHMTLDHHESLEESADIPAFIKGVDYH